LSSRYAQYLRDISLISEAQILEKKPSQNSKIPANKFLNLIKSPDNTDISREPVSSSRLKKGNLKTTPSLDFNSRTSLSSRESLVTAPIRQTLVTVTSPSNNMYGSLSGRSIKDQILIAKPKDPNSIVVENEKISLGSSRHLIGKPVHTRVLSDVKSPTSSYMRTLETSKSKSNRNDTQPRERKEETHHENILSRGSRQVENLDESYLKMKKYLTNLEEESRTSHSNSRSYLRRRKAYDTINVSQFDIAYEIEDGEPLKTLKVEMLEDDPLNTSYKYRIFGRDIDKNE